jgi:hypothetical protein
MTACIHAAPENTSDNFDTGQSKYWCRFCGKHMRLGVKANCVTLSKLPNISGPQVPRGKYYFPNLTPRTI